MVAEGAKGFDAPETAGWLAAAIADASAAYFGPPPGSAGEGGTIPFLDALQEQYPTAQFLVTGVLGPESNAHGPNEMLHLPDSQPRDGVGRPRALGGALIVQVADAPARQR